MRQQTDGEDLSFQTLVIETVCETPFVSNRHLKKTGLSIYMLVTFTTDAYVDITMFGEIALAMLKMMGRSAAVPGAILSVDIPAALSRLTAAIDAAKVQPPLADRDSDEPSVSMANRALPLINLLEAAAKAESDVLWK